MNTIDDPTTVAGAAPAPAPAKKNPWFEFQTRVRGLTHMSPPDAMRLCSALKAKKAYDEWADKEIVKFAFDWVKEEAAGGAGETSAGLSAEEIARLEVRAAKFGTATPDALETLKKEKKASSKKKKEDDPVVVIEMPAKVVEAPAPAPAPAETPKEKKAPRKKKDASPPPPAVATAVANPMTTESAQAALAAAQAEAAAAVAKAAEAQARLEALAKVAEAKARADAAAAAAAEAAKKAEEEQRAAEAAAAALLAPSPAPTPAVIEHVEAAVAAKKPRKKAEKKEEVATPAVVAVSAPPVAERRPKAKIPKHIKNLVWNKYIGADNATAKCLCCRQATISNTSFDCGHVIAEANGGDMNINNLRPICRDCNAGMGTRSMNDFTTEFFGWTV